MIRIENLTKHYRGAEVPAVDNISLHIRKGEAAALLGENGAGKTTAIRILSTLLKPDSGDCLINSFSILKDPENVRKNTGILLGGETGLYARLTAGENIEYFGRLHGIDIKTIKERTAMFSRILDMDKFLDRRCATFSKGMKQKTAIARSLIHDPPVIILDEPTSGLDLSVSRKVREFILFLKNSGKSVLFSSHNMGEVLKTADRIIIMHSGKIIDSGKPSELEKKYSMEMEDIFHFLTGGRNEG